MELILEFYQGLDTLNLIIFWGIIIVIILLLILSIILINKNKNLKRIVNNTIKEEEIPIINEEKTNSINIDINKNEKETKESIEKENTSNIETKEIKHIETESNFIAEEHIKKYHENNLINPNSKPINDEIKRDIENIDNKINYSKEIEIPTKPYQRNVLREMSLSQTSPIGITRPINKEEKKLELAKDLENSLKKKEEEQKEITRERNMMQNEELKKQLSKIEKINTNRKTEIVQEEKKLEQKEVIPTKENVQIYERNYSLKNPYFTKFEELNEIEIPKIQNDINTIEENNFEKINEEKNNEEKNNEYIPPQVKELLASTQPEVKERNIKSSSEMYLEEVSRKLAEAEISDEVERTEYELEQEENAIISYKELMEKKDSIKTIDEEEAIISIEELMNKKTNKSSKQEEQPEELKLYNLSEEEENDNFLKELKEFRKDL